MTQPPEPPREDSGAKSREYEGAPLASTNNSRVPTTARVAALPIAAVEKNAAFVVEDR